MKRFHRAGGRFGGLGQARVAAGTRFLHGMINGVRIKVCGLTSLVDADLADTCGADYLGFILHAKSPRYLPLGAFSALAGRLPPRRKVAVSVNPTTSDLKAQVAAGFDFFQVHFPHDTAVRTVAEWSQAVGRERLWLAPKLPVGTAFDETWIQLADTLLWDTYHPGGYGGSGLTGDWTGFARQRTEHPKHTWILAGGLNAGNVAEALQVSGTRFVDVNSGVEQAPGIKSEARLKQFIVALHGATKHRNPAYASVG